MTKIKHDTAAGAAQAFASAQLKIKPPKHCTLQSGADAFYNAIIDSREKSQWNDVDLARAVTLANYQCMIERNTIELLSEGEVVTNERGTPIMNPRFTVVNTLARLEISLSKSLQTDAASTQGRSQDASGRNKKAAEAKRVIDEFADDDLIPMATH